MIRVLMTGVDVLVDDVVRVLLLVVLVEETRRDEVVLDAGSQKPQPSAPV